jgi:hypothetical protein
MNKENDMSVSNEDVIIDRLMGIPASRLQATFDLLGSVMERHGASHIGNLVTSFSRQHGLPKVSNQQFIAAMEKALNRKLLMLDPETDINNLIS